MQNKVTDIQLSNYIGWKATIAWLEDEIRRYDEAAQACTSAISGDGAKVKSFVVDKMARNVTSKVDCERILTELRENVDQVDAFMAELRFTDSLAALAIEFYYFDEDECSYQRARERLRRYMPRAKVPSISAMRRKINSHVIVKNDTSWQKR